mgnify:CR=1 FL=1
MRALIVGLLMLSSCVTPGGLMPDGQETTPPYGWEQYCLENPEDVSCRH